MRKRDIRITVSSFVACKSKIITDSCKGKCQHETADSEMTLFVAGWVFRL
jgi:hypothetical protein